MIKKMAERVGFEPTAPCGVTGFQDRLLKPLGHLSVSGFHQVRHLGYHILFGMSTNEEKKLFWMALGEKMRVSGKSRGNR